MLEIVLGISDDGSCIYGKMWLIDHPYMFLCVGFCPQKKTRFDFLSVMVIEAEQPKMGKLNSNVEGGKNRFRKFILSPKKLPSQGEK